MLSHQAAIRIRQHVQCVPSNNRIARIISRQRKGMSRTHEPVVDGTRGPPPGILPKRRRQTSSPAETSSIAASPTQPEACPPASRQGLLPLPKNDQAAAGREHFSGLPSSLIDELLVIYFTHIHVCLLPSYHARSLTKPESLASHLQAAVHHLVNIHSTPTGYTMRRVLRRARIIIPRGLRQREVVFDGRVGDQAKLGSDTC